MPKTPIKKLLVIIVVTLLAILVDLPRDLPIKFSLGKFQIDTHLIIPNIAISLGPLKVEKELHTRFGLDLLGGTQLTFEADIETIPTADRSSAIEAVKNVIDRRINFFGVTEPIIQTSTVGNSHRVIVELPGIKDINQAIDLIGKTAQLEFRTREASPSAAIATSAASLFGFTIKTPLSGKDLTRSSVQFDQNTGQPIVSLGFNPGGAKKFEDITRANIGKQVAIVLDNQIISAPTVEEAISGGNAVIRGSFTPEEAKDLSIALNAGALPVPVHIIQQRNIGATLGLEALQQSLIAAILGFIVVALFMVANYGKNGVVAVLALVIYTLLVFALFKLIPVTLTLAGIAGFILSIGMAVDANILIFERMKEELRLGKSEQSAQHLGFSRAFPSIRDSNVSSLITCVILYWFGTGLIRGFALTLAIGIAVSLFTAITVTKTLVQLIRR